MKLLIVDEKNDSRKAINTAISDKVPGLEIVMSKNRDFPEAVEMDRFNIVLISAESFQNDTAAVVKNMKKQSPSSTVCVYKRAGTQQETFDDAGRAGIDSVFVFPDELEAITGMITRTKGEADASFLENGVIAAADTFGIIGRSPAIQSINDFIVKSAPSTLPVLIEGESGTGKELVANAIHKSSPRSDKVFIAVNCGALPKDLLENELFGHEAGAFTGATAMKRGLFEIADGGTLFIDEIGEMDPSAQVKLLRVLETGDFRRLGSTKQIKSDVRVLAATNRVLESEIEKGRFRMDLYYRLNALRVFLPPLRERPDDIPLLVKHFLSRSAGGKKKSISRDTLEMLSGYKWPGNIRELSNTVERAVVVSGARQEITIRDLPDYILKYTPACVKEEIDYVTEAPLSEFLDKAEKIYLSNLLQKYGGNKVRLAKTLKISRAKLYRKLNKHSIL